MAPDTTNNVPAVAISHRKVVGLVTRSMNVFLPMNGRCQSLRNRR
ncbi:Uncharacterised protein [Mycobacteroides abscessus subsp. abscessus]|nr:Uncharacterised protein [Mycobacteroides abscessus subsp. abscessus]SKU11115.1 Uncharacterised protein [Mycobacteroides abscessus subsp. abscessus]